MSDYIGTVEEYEHIFKKIAKARLDLWMRHPFFMEASGKTPSDVRHEYLEAVRDARTRAEDKVIKEMLEVL